MWLGNAKPADDFGLSAGLGSETNAILDRNIELSVLLICAETKGNVSVWHIRRMRGMGFAGIFQYSETMVPCAPSWGDD